MRLRGSWLFATLVLLALAAYAGPDAGTPAGHFHWPTPGLIDVVDIGEVVSAGVPTRLQRVRLKGTPEQLFQIYADAFTKAGLYISPPKSQPQMEGAYSLTAFNTVTQHSYTVILSAGGENVTLAILGEARPADIRRETEDGFPLPPSARRVLRTEQEGSRVLTFEVDKPGSEIMKFYETHLGKAGFQQDETDAPGVFVREKSSVRVVLREQRPGTTSVVIVRIGSVER